MTSTEPFLSTCRRKPPCNLGNVLRPGPGNRRCLGWSNRPLPAPKPIGKGVGRSPPPIYFDGLSERAGAMWTPQIDKFGGSAGGFLIDFTGYLLSFSYSCQICNFGSGPENGHELALYLVSGVNFGCVLHHVSSPTRWSGSRGQVRPETDQKPNTNHSFYFYIQRG